MLLAMKWHKYAIPYRMGDLFCGFRKLEIREKCISIS